MSFRQDRTNPSTAVSNWKGRSETPKGHPSTQVDTWMNGGLFGGGGATGPYMEYISTFTVGSTTSITCVITGIPTTYRDIVIVGQNMRLITYGNAYTMRPSNDGSYSAATHGLWAKSDQNNAQVNQATEYSSSGLAAALKGQAGVMDIANNSQLWSHAIQWWPNSSSSTQQKKVINLQDGTGYINSSDAGRSTTDFVAYNKTDGMEEIELNGKGASGGTDSNYYWVAGTKFHIYGIGTAI
jgi:hypothetical protein